MQKPPRGSRSLRIGRRSLANHVYHITTGTEGRRPVFVSFVLGRFVVDALRHEDNAGHAETLAFVVMPDHLHWLVRLSGSRDLSVIVNSVKSFSARNVNSNTGRSGRLWQKGFHDHAIRADEDLMATARYIIANPLRAGLVRSVGEYPLWDAKWI